MIRTRDYCLFLVTVLFLVGGISVSVVREVAVPGGQQGAVLESVREDVVPVATNLTATASPPAAPDRPNMLAAMREKIAELGATIMARAPEPEVIVATNDEPVAAVLDDGEPAAAAWQCASAKVVTLPSLLGAQFKEAEGARVVYRSGAPVAPESVTGTTTNTTLPPISNDVILIQLPLRTSPLSSPTCLPYDVVGIATDGSLIQNDEQSLYAVFGRDTLVGYALDGFPIYGNNDDIVTDRCGGVVAQGTYRYYLSSQREAVLGCFSGVPVAL